MLANDSSMSDSFPIYNSSDARFISFLAFSAVKFLLVFPLWGFVLYLGFQRRRRQRPVSHSDIITYHMAVLELLWGPGFIFYLCGNYLYSLAARRMGAWTFSMVFYGEMVLHTLTCVDRYLAVVHPIVYIRLRSTRGAKIRNICITSGWLLCLGVVCYDVFVMEYKSITSLVCFLAVSILVITFCSFSVLCALIHPRQGEGGGEKERVDQLKRRAFHTITAIWLVLVLGFVSLLISNTMADSPLLTERTRKNLFAVLNWFNLPIGLVSLLLYLQRAGRLICSCFRPQHSPSGCHTADSHSLN